MPWEISKQTSVCFKRLYWCAEMKHPSCTIKIRHFLQHRFDILKMVEVNSVILVRKLHLSLMEKFVPLFEVAYEYLLNPSFAGVSMMCTMRKLGSRFRRSMGEALPKNIKDRSWSKPCGPLKHYQDHGWSSTQVPFSCIVLPPIFINIQKTLWINSMIDCDLHSPLEKRILLVSVKNSLSLILKLWPHGPDSQPGKQLFFLHPVLQWVCKFQWDLRSWVYTPDNVDLVYLISPR